MTRDEVHAWVRAYADTFDAPVAQGVEVVRVEQRPEGGFTVVDVGSLNGTYVNREPVDASPLAHGDEVQIGKFRLVFFVPAAG